MSTTISGTVISASKFLFQSSQPLNVTLGGSVSKSYERSFTSSDVTLLYFNTYTVTTTPTVIDVTSLTDAFGTAISFATVKHLAIVNNDTANTVTAGGGTNPLFSALPSLVGHDASTGSDGSAINLTTNLSVSGTVKNIRLVAGSGTAVVDVVIAGA